MPVTHETPEMKAVRLAIAGEVRASIARKRLSGSEIARQLGVEQTWFSRRYSGRVPWTAAELQLVMDIIDEDITRVFAAGQAARQVARKTNPCLSESATVGSEHLGEWARRGLEMGRRLFPHQFDRDRAAA